MEAFTMMVSGLGVQHFLLFVMSAGVFVLTPGIDTVFVINRTLVGGRRLGVMAALGVATGVLVHTLLAALGLAAILASSAALFSLVKYLGAAYLIYLGVMALYQAYQGGAKLDVQAETSPMTPMMAYRSGLLTNVLNPKVALFFLSFFPQFIDVAHLGEALPYVLLGVVYALISVIWLVLLAFVGALFVNYLQSQRARRTMDGVSGAVFVWLGAKLGLT